jgi:transcriptional regulator with XRE-family HTH domain
MTRPTSPTLSRRWIAREMKRLRLQADLQQAEVAKALGCRVPKVSLMESGTRPVQEQDLKKLLDLFDVPAADHQLYFDQLANAQEKAWWEHYDETIVPGWFGEFIGLEQGAKRIRAYQPAIIYGLLQTREYTEALLRAGADEASEEKISRQAELRQARQARFLGSGVQELKVVLDEAALHRVVGDRDVMRRQLEQVIDICSSHPLVSLRVAPFDQGSPYEAGYGAFTILTSPLPRDPGVVYMEHRSSASYLETLGDINVYSLLFARVSDLALSEGESMAMLRKQARSYS